MAQKLIKGDDLMLFNGTTGKSYAYATAHTLTITADTADTSSKDHGVWTGNEVAKISWEITSENLYTSEGFDSLFNDMINRKPIDVAFGLKQQGAADKTVADGDYANWTPEYKTDTTGEPTAPSTDTTTSKMYMGKVYITSLTANANTGENATYSVTLTGTGSIKHAAGAKVDQTWMTGN